jgi:Zn-dependent peptidase ImmA (M78 family)
MNVFRARNKAKKLLREYSPYTSPLNLDEFSNSHGIEIKYKELPEDISGIYEPHSVNEKCRVFVNICDHKHRQRFSIAHELGHHFLCHSKDIIVDKIYRDHKSSLGTYAMEVEANNFAAELIMPSDQIMSFVDEYINDGVVEQDIEMKLSKRFMVSTEAISYKLKSLGFDFEIE